MSDLVERLRQKYPETPHHRDSLHSEAADRIEHLERVLAQAREALAWSVEQGGGPICEHESGGSVCFCKENQAIATIDEAMK